MGSLIVKCTRVETSQRAFAYDWRVPTYEIYSSAWKFILVFGILGNLQCNYILAVMFKPIKRHVTGRKLIVMNQA